MLIMDPYNILKNECKNFQTFFNNKCTKETVTVNNGSHIALDYLRPVASIESSSSRMSLVMLGPIALAAMLMQVKTAGSTVKLFCFLNKTYPMNICVNDS